MIRSQIIDQWNFPLYLFHKNFKCSQIIGSTLRQYVQLDIKCPNNNWTNDILTAAL